MMSVSTSCIRCQTPLDSDTRFCPVCGLSVTGDRTEPLPTLLELLRQATQGEYEVLREAGQGGMATVFLGHEIALNRKVAIKVMSPQLVHGSEMIERFKREARTAAGLDHPHIIPIYAVRESQHLLFFVMKYVSGRSLDAILREVGALPFPMIRAILSDVGSALDYAHRQGVIHRDVKPGNIMLDGEGFAVLTDFGIARAAEGEALTRSGTTVGTPSYLSPEACSGEKVGPASDQYSLGIVGYEMVTGFLPFTAESSLGMMYAQVHNAPRSSDTFRPDCPDDMRDAVLRMLEKAPEDRFPTMREATQAIAGGRPVGGQAGGDDHVRTDIGLLAAPAPDSPDRASGQTASSTVPTPRPPRSASSQAKRKKKRVQITSILFGLGLAGLGAAAALLTRRAGQDTGPGRDSAPPVSAASAATDSALLVASGAARQARQQAQFSGASATALAAGDSLMAQAESLTVHGRKTEAAILIERAAGVFGSAARPTLVQAPAARTPRVRDSGPNREGTPGAAPGPARAAPAGPSPEPATAPALGDSATAVTFYAELERAVESRQLGEVQRLLPNLTDSDIRSWRSLFDDDNLSGVDATYRVLHVTRTDNTLYVRLSWDVHVTKHNGKTERKKQANEFTELTQGPTGWKQVKARKAS